LYPCPALLRWRSKGYSPGLSQECSYQKFNDRNLNEAIDLIYKALLSEPDNYIYLDTKGWGLFKQGKYREALEFLEKSWALKPVYDHEVYLHLEAAKKAIANLNNN
jgi:tetratricopeptide (TPR) repeat protein